MVVTGGWAGGGLVSATEEFVNAFGPVMVIALRPSALPRISAKRIVAMTYAGQRFGRGSAG